MNRKIFAAVASIALAGLCAWGASGQEWAEPREIFVAPHGRPDGEGTREDPLTFRAAFEEGAGVAPGTTVWVAEGTYKGHFTQGEKTVGTQAAPVIFRAIPGYRATIEGGLMLLHDNIWLWGLEVTGPSDHGVNIRGGGHIRLINMVIHSNGPAVMPEEREPVGNGIGGWDVGDEHEYYGNIIYQNGWFTLDHGIYTQNTARHTTKRIINNIIFENAGFGIHVYGSAPRLANFLIEGNICFATSQLPRNPGGGECNILVGGSQPVNNIVLKENMTWHPNDNSKRGLDIGYIGSPNRNILVEGNYLMNGSNAMELKGVAQAVVRGNTFWAPQGMVSVTYAPDDELRENEPNVVFERNNYIDNGNFDLNRFRESVGSAHTDRLIPGRLGRPTNLMVFARRNHYEPNRIHIAVYNWDSMPNPPLSLEGFISPGDRYRLVSAMDFYGEPILEGVADGHIIRLPMGGRRYEPEFGVYILFIEPEEE